MNYHQMKRVLSFLSSPRSFYVNGEYDRMDINGYEPHEFGIWGIIKEGKTITYELDDLAEDTLSFLQDQGINITKPEIDRLTKTRNTIENILKLANIEANYFYTTSIEDGNTRVYVFGPDSIGNLFDGIDIKYTKMAVTDNHGVYYEIHND